MTRSILTVAVLVFAKVAITSQVVSQDARPTKQSPAMSTEEQPILDNSAAYATPNNHHKILGAWMKCDRELGVFLFESGGKYYVPSISPRPRHVASWTGRTHVPLSCYVYMCTGEIAGSLLPHETQIFMAGHSVTYAFITEHHRAGPAVDGTTEQKTAMERYGTVTMNYVHFSAYHYRSGQRASSCSTDVERDDHVFTDLARRSSIIKAGKKLSGCRFRSCSGLDRFSTGHYCGNERGQRRRETQSCYCSLNYLVHKSCAFSVCFVVLGLL